MYVCFDCIEASLLFFLGSVLELVITPRVSSSPKPGSGWEVRENGNSVEYITRRIFHRITIGSFILWIRTRSRRVWMVLLVDVCMIHYM